nr:MAG TPA: hypothetical protein [Caudoviricetes sp.]
MILGNLIPKTLSLLEMSVMSNLRLTHTLEIQLLELFLNLEHSQKIEMILLLISILR